MNWIKNTKTNRRKLLHGEAVIVNHDGGVDSATYNDVTKKFEHPYFGQIQMGNFKRVTHFCEIELPNA